jgi:hypothetical protein
MELSTYSQVKSLDQYEENKKYKDIRKYKPKRLEEYVEEYRSNEKNDSNFSTAQRLRVEKDEKIEVENVLLDISLRDLFEDFILVWNKIILDLLSETLYKNLYNKDEKDIDWWIILYRRIVRIISVFWVKERIMHIGIGLIIISFLMYFIFVTK